MQIYEIEKSKIPLIILSMLILVASISNFASSSSGLDVSINQPANNYPVLKNIDPVQVAVAGESFELDIDAEDKDNDILEYSVQFDGINLFSIDSRTGIISFVPSEEQVGEHNVRIRVSDRKVRDFQDIKFIIKKYRPEFTINETSLSLLLKTGEQEIDAFKINNTGKEDLDATIKENFDFVDTRKQIRIGVGNEEDVLLNFSSTETGVFTGSIFIKSANVIKELPLIAEIESKNVSVDAMIEIDSESKKFYSGEELAVKVFVFNLLNKKEDVVIDYKILDMYNNIIAEEHETLAVITKNTLIRTFYLPSYLPKGDYVIGITARYNDSAGTSSSLFQIVKKEKKGFIDYLRGYILYILAVLIIFIVFIISFANYIKLKKIERFRTPVKIYKFFKKTGNAEKAIKKLNRQASVLENAFDEGYINKSFYLKSKTKLEGMIKDIKKKAKTDQKDL